MSALRQPLRVSKLFSAVLALDRAPQGRATCGTCSLSTLQLPGQALRYCQHAQTALADMQSSGQCDHLVIVLVQVVCRLLGLPTEGRVLEIPECPYIAVKYCASFQNFLCPSKTFCQEHLPRHVHDVHMYLLQ